MSNRIMLRQNEMNSTDSNNTIAYIPILSNQQPNFGSIVSWDVANFPGKILDLQVILNCGPLANAGVASAVTNTPVMVSAFHWPIIQQYQYGNNVLEIQNNHHNYILQMLYNHDQDIRFLIGSSGGTQSQRFVLSNTTSNWNIPLKSFVNTIKVENLGLQYHNFRISLTLDQLVNLCTPVLGTITIPTMVINSATLMAKVVRYDSMTIDFKQMQLKKNVNYRDIFFNHVSQQFIANTGSLTSSILLSNFANTNVQFVYFTIRPVASLIRETTATYINNITSFNLFNSTNESLSAGPISSLMSLMILNKANTKSSFTVDVGNSVFGYFHCLDPIKTMTYGTPSGSRPYTGSESLFITWNAALTAAHQVDVYASTISIFNQSMSSVIKQ